MKLFVLLVAVLAAFVASKSIKTEGSAKRKIGEILFLSNIKKMKIMDFVGIMDVHIGPVGSFRLGVNVSVRGHR